MERAGFLFQLNLDGGGWSDPDAIGRSDDGSVDARVFQLQHVEEVADAVGDGTQREDARLVSGRQRNWVGEKDVLKSEWISCRCRVGSSSGEAFLSSSEDPRFKS